MFKKYFIPLAFFILLLVCWEMGGRAFNHWLLVLPQPTQIIVRVWEGADRFLFHAYATFKTMVGGFMLAFMFAFPLAWLMVYNFSARLIFQPLFVLIQCIPAFTLAPIMVIWFGWSFIAIVIPTAFMIFFPLTMNIYQGIRSTPPNLIEYFQCNRATRWQMFYKLQLPYAMPQIFAGFRIAAAIAGIGAIAGEWAGAQEGLGLMMLESKRSMDLETTFGSLFCLALLSLGFYGIISLMEKIALRRRFLSVVKSSLLVSITLTGLTLGSCNTAPSKTQEVRLALDWLPNPNHVALYTGLHKGIFEKHGIPLILYKTHDPANAMPYLYSNQVELAVTYMPSFLRAKQRGAALQVIGILIAEPLNAIIYRKDSEITTPADLNGKVLGHCSDGTGTKCLDRLLAMNKIVLKDKKNVTYDLVSTLGTKLVDALYGACWNIQCEQFRSLGIETGFFKLNVLGMPNYHELIIVARQNSAQNSPEFMIHFQEALQESIDYSRMHPDEAFDIYFAANPDKSEKTRHWEMEAWRKTYPLLAQQQKIDENAWAEFEEWLSDVVKK